MFGSSKKDINFKAVEGLGKPKPKKCKVGCKILTWG